MNMTRAVPFLILVAIALAALFDISQHSEYLDLEPFRQFGGHGKELGGE